jgi:hypothetical protein
MVGVDDVRERPDLPLETGDAWGGLGMSVEPLASVPHALAQALVRTADRRLFAVEAGELGASQTLPTVFGLDLPPPPQLGLFGERAAPATGFRP